MNLLRQLQVTSPLSSSALYHPDWRGTSTIVAVLPTTAGIASAALVKQQPITQPAMQQANLRTCMCHLDQHAWDNRLLPTIGGTPLSLTRSTAGTWHTYLTAQAIQWVASTPLL
jgi:hypothetical protein